MRTSPEQYADAPGAGGPRRSRRWLTGIGLAAGGAVAGAVLAGTLSAGAATPTPAPGPSGPAAGTVPPGARSAPGVQENDGIPEASEHHGHGPGRAALGLRGVVTAVGAHTVTITPTGGPATVYTVGASSDIDKNGEAQLSALVPGDAVTYSLASGTTTIDKLHAGDEAKDRPVGPPPGAGAADFTGPATASA